MRYLLALALFMSFQDADPIPALIAKLSDEKLEIRDQASRDLRKLGEKAVEPLKKALEAAGDPELKARLADLLMKLDAEFRRKSFQGGKPVAGLCVRLQVDRAEVKAGAPFAFTVEILNISDGEIEFSVPAGSTRRLPGYSHRGLADDLVLVAKMTKGTPPKLAAGGIS